MEVMCNRVLCYLLQGSVQKETNADDKKTYYCGCLRFGDSNNTHDGK